MNRSLLALAALATALVPAASHAQIVYMRSVPTFDPNGSFNFPFGNLRASLCGSFQTPADVRISPGTYFEAGTYTRAATITAPSGPVTISSQASAVVPLRVVCYNVRLWPGFFASLILNDNERAEFIGDRLATENADVIAIQESWDYRLDSVDASGRNNALKGGVYNNQYYGGAFLQGTDNVNSGLLTQSVHALSGGQQFRYIECDGTDCQASKGWTRVTFTKSGIPVTVFNTHTQAGDSSENEQTRADQMTQFVSDILVFRSLNPSHVIIAAGDFNVDRLGAEFSSTFAPLLRGSGMADAALNEQCSPQTSACTSCLSNTMKQIFGGTSSTLLDYIFYSAPANGSVEVVPINYAVRQYRRTDGGQWCRTVEPTGCTTDYSDHEPIVADFELRRITP
jgi:endonuclease/exonuclease/phosphatase family metal-dependent hydrolase